MASNAATNSSYVLLLVLNLFLDIEIAAPYPNFIIIPVLPLKYGGIANNEFK